MRDIIFSIQSGTKLNISIQSLIGLPTDRLYLKDYPIPNNTEEILALQNNKSVNEEIVATAIAGVVQMARRQGQSLEELTASILQDDLVLDLERRKWLSEMIIQAWDILPSSPE